MQKRKTESWQIANYFNRNNQKSSGKLYGGEGVGC